MRQSQREASSTSILLPVSAIEHGLCRWLERLREHRASALIDTSRADHVLAQWELQWIEVLVPNLREIVDAHTWANAPGGGEIQLHLNPMEIGFLVHVLAFGRRRLEASHTDGTSAELRWLNRMISHFWQAMDTGGSYFAILPYRYVHDQLLPHFESYLSLTNMGFEPPDFDEESDAFMRAYSGVLAQVLKQYQTRFKEDAETYWLVLPASPHEIAMLSGSSLGLLAAGNNKAERDAAEQAVEFLAEFLDPESADRLKAAMASLTGRNPTEATATSRPQSAVNTQLAIHMVCSACGHHFYSEKAYCPNCDEQTDAQIDFLKRMGAPTADELAAGVEAQRRIPDPLPLGVLIAGGIAAGILSVGTFLFDRITGYYFIFLFPAAIGIATGFISAVMAINRSQFFRSYYWAIPILLAVLGYASTFWFDYEVSMTELEDLGYTNAREVISFSDYMAIRAEQPFSLSRRYGASSTEDANPNRSDWYLLWSIEAAAAAGGAYWGWRKAIRYKHRTE